MQLWVVKFHVWAKDEFCNYRCNLWGRLSVGRRLKIVLQRHKACSLLQEHDYHACGVCLCIHYTHINVMSIGPFWYGIRVLLAWVKKEHFIYRWAGGTLQGNFFSGTSAFGEPALYKQWQFERVFNITGAREEDANAKMLQCCMRDYITDVIFFFTCPCNLSHTFQMLSVLEICSLFLGCRNQGQLLLQRIRR